VKTKQQSSKDFADEFFELADGPLKMQPMVKTPAGNSVQCYREGDHVLADDGEITYRIVGHWGYWNNAIVDMRPWDKDRQEWIEASNQERSRDDG
jgi:hypothetical protein